MANIDSYSLDYASAGGLALTSGASRTAAGQSFTGNGATAYYATFLLFKTGSPTGNITFNIYAHSGTYGTSSVPTGAAIATSNTLDATTLTTSNALYTLPFSTPLATVNGTNYVVTCEYSTGDGSNFVSVVRDSTGLAHSGNTVNFTSSAWAAISSQDTVFYVADGSGSFSAPTHYYTKQGFQ